jgi:hypothetical protein
MSGFDTIMLVLAGVVIFGSMIVMAIGVIVVP